MPQVGIPSSAFLRIHNHLNDDQGGVLNEYSRFGAFREAYRTGALAVHVDNDPERSVAGMAGYVLLKQFTVNVAQRGEYRISWEMRNADDATPVHVRVAINGVDIPASDQVTALNIYVGKIYNYDVDLAEGDLVQLFGDPQGDEVFVQSFRLYYDWCVKYFHDGTNGRVLVAPLALSDVSLIDVTADF